MADTIRIQVRWPVDLVDRLRAIASQRHTTFSELIRQAAIERYLLPTDDTKIGTGD